MSKNVQQWALKENLGEPRRDKLKNDLLDAVSVVAGVAGRWRLTEDGGGLV